VEPPFLFPKTKPIFLPGVFAPFLQKRRKAKSSVPTDSQPPSREGGFFWNGPLNKKSQKLNATAQNYF
jgi:hypothetical protein